MRDKQSHHETRETVTRQAHLGVRILEEFCFRRLMPATHNTAFTTRGPRCWHDRERAGTYTCAGESWITPMMPGSSQHACKGSWGWEMDKRPSLSLADNQAPFSSNALSQEGKARKASSSHCNSWNIQGGYSLKRSIPLSSWTWSVASMRADLNLI